MQRLPAERIQTAKKWLALGHDATTPYDAFSNYWWAFSSLLPSSMESERRRISGFVSDCVSEDTAGAMLKDAAEQVSFLMRIPVRDMRDQRRNTSNEMQRYQSASTDLEKLDAVMMVVYMVRCNLQHGHKVPDSERDQKLCVAAGTMVVAVTTSCL